MADDCSFCENTRCCGFDFCGVLCASVSWFVLGFVWITVWVFLEDLPSWLLVMFSTLVALGLLSHVAAMTADPGFIMRGADEAEWSTLSDDFSHKFRQDQLEKRNAITAENETENQEFEEIKTVDGIMEQRLIPKRKKSFMSDKEIEFRVKRAVEKFRRTMRFCKVCLIFKPAGAHHCSVCRRCVGRMDHHCPWVNNCVGELNLRYFILFLFYVFLGSITGICIFLYRSFVAVYHPKRARYASSDFDVAGLICCTISVILCFFFCVFVVAMAFEQYEAVTSGIPGIDALQDEGEDEGLSLCQGLRKHACNDVPIGVHWFTPCPLKKKNKNTSTHKLD